eukprot:IDg19507t1
MPLLDHSVTNLNALEYVSSAEIHAPFYSEKEVERILLAMLLISKSIESCVDPAARHDTKLKK